MSKKIKEAVDKKTKDMSNVLDIGCGDKPYYPFFEGKCKKYVGLDIHPGKNIDVVSKAEKLPFKEKSFDTIVCFQALEHIEDPKKAINEMHRVLKKNGILILTTHGNWHVHGIPYDYWRWTNYGLKKELKRFRDVEVSAIESPGMALFQIINLYVQRLNLFHLMTPLLVINNIIGRVCDKILPASVTKDLFVLSYIAIAKK